MRLYDNPFYILGVTPYDNMETINEKAEEKSFMDDVNESIYENARLVLSSPTKRLSAEYRWFYKSDVDVEAFVSDVEEKRFSLSYDYDVSNARENVILLTEKLYALPTERLSEIIVYLDSEFFDACYRYEVEDLTSSINFARKKAGIRSMCDEDTVATEIYGILGDIQDGLNYIFNTSSRGNIVDLVNEIAESTIGVGKSYGRVIESLIENYKLYVQDSLEKHKDYIMTLVSEPEDIEDMDDLEDLFDAARNFDYIAQPLQLFLLDRGQSKLQSESVEVAESIRNLAIYLYNEKGLADETIALINLEMELFSELPEVYARLEEDKKFLTKIRARNLAFEKLESILDDVENNIVREDAYAESNKAYLNSHVKRIKDELVQFVEMTNQNYSPEDDDYKVLCLRLVKAYKYMGNVCTWAEMWVNAFDFFQSALFWGYKLKDVKLLRVLAKDLDEVKQIIDAEREAVKEKEREQNKILFNEMIDQGYYKVPLTVYGSGIGFGQQFTNFNSIYGIRWSDYSHSIKIDISATDNNLSFTVQEPRASQLIKIFWDKILLKIINDIIKRIKNGEVIDYGSFLIYDTGLHISRPRYSYDRSFFEWKDITLIPGKNDDILYIYGDDTYSCSMSYSETDNTYVIEAIINTLQRKGFARLTDFLKN